MENLELLHSVTLSRKKIKDARCYGEQFDKENQMQMHVLPKNDMKLPVAQSWRVMSSEIVARRHSSEWMPNAEENHFSQQDSLPQVVPEKYFLDSISTNTLRTPIKRPKQKSVPHESNMTKNCQSLFLRMRNSQPKKINFHPDPSYSVRRIVNNSGLLQCSQMTGLQNPQQAFDSDISRNREFSSRYYQLSPVPEESMIPSPQSSPVPVMRRYASEDSLAMDVDVDYQDYDKMNCFNNEGGTFNNIDDDPIPLYSVFNSCQPFTNRVDMNVPASPPSSPISLDLEETTDAYDRRVSSPTRAEDPGTGNVPSYKQPLSQLFDTIVYRKTVETEVVEYDYSETETLPSSSTSKKMPSKRKRDRNKQLNSQRNKRLKHREAQSGYDPSSETENSS